MRSPEVNKGLHITDMKHTLELWRQTLKNCCTSVLRWLCGHILGRPKAFMKCPWCHRIRQHHSGTDFVDFRRPSGLRRMHPQPVFDLFSSCFLTWQSFNRQRKQTCLIWCLVTLASRFQKFSWRHARQKPEKTGDPASRCQKFLHAARNNIAKAKFLPRCARQIPKKTADPV